MDYKIINMPSYQGKMLCSDCKTSIAFYTKKQMKTIYPHGGFLVVGEINNKTGVQCGAANNLDETPLPIYKEQTHSKLTEKIIGYTSVGNNKVLAVVKNVLIERILVALSIIALVIATILITNNYDSLLHIFSTSQAV